MVGGFVMEGDLFCCRGGVGVGMGAVDGDEGGRGREEDACEEFVICKVSVNGKKRDGEERVFGRGIELT